MAKIVDLINEVLINHEDEKVLKAVRKKVNKLMEKFPLY
jgi:glycine hydroxymethyltransferase